MLRDRKGAAVKPAMRVAGTSKLFVRETASNLSMGDLRLGDVIDDHCIKCRRITNHAIVSLLNGAAAKVRCRTCYHDHDYRHEQAPPTKKELMLKKAEAEAAAALAKTGAEDTQPA
jgi:hypothetical protein